YSRRSPRRPRATCGSACRDRIWCAGRTSVPPCGPVADPRRFEAPLGAILQRGLDRVARDRAPIRIVGLDDPLDRAHPLVEPPGELVQLVEQILVLGGDR